MFVACPHCQFLVAQHPQTRALPPACPRCDRALESDTVARATPSLAAYLQPVDAADATPAADGAPAAAVADATTEAPATPAVDEKTVAVDAEAPLHVAAPQEPVEPEREDAADAAQPSGTTTPSDIDTAAPADVADAVPAGAPTPDAMPQRATAKPTPRFTQAARTAPVHARAARWQWGVLAVLLLLFGVQVVLADRDRLASQAGWRPVVVALCGVFACDVPTWREPAAFAMLSRDVRPVSGAPGQLQARATFRNDARWTQAWPVILLTLKDADGRTLGARALQPQDYLAEIPPQDGIAPGQSAQVAVRVREPSANVVAFSFDFR